MYKIVETKKAQNNLLNSIKGYFELLYYTEIDVQNSSNLGDRNFPSLVKH